MSWIPARPHTFIEVELEIFSKVILLLLLIQEGPLSVTREKVHRVLVNCLVVLAYPGRLTDGLDMTIAVDWDLKS